MDAAKETPNIISCQPIKLVSEVEKCILNPPEWIERVTPLKKRSGFIKKNFTMDCHSSRSAFIAQKYTDGKNLPKTLVCHDYRGGYLTDAYIPATKEDEKNLAKEGYSFYNWSQIDYFVYFSHHFLTIPPLSWINVAHKNGVKIFGTLITESNDGETICNEKIFNNQDSMREFAYNLVQLLEIFGFDGWLLNIENKVKNPDIVKEFVEILTKRTHDYNAEHMILWYDSVTKDGHLKWQDQLNEHNKCFFDACDGIFLNYCWDEDKLANSVREAGSRKCEIFVGVDIFGRNMFGGGMFNTFKALEVISKFGLSVAIFAPGWTYETMQKSPETTVFSRFLTRNDTLWLSLWTYLYTHPITELFQTNFHLGIDSDTYSLFRQQHQMSRILYPDDPNHIPDFTTILPLNVTCDCLKRCHVGGTNACFISKEKLKTVTPNAVHNLFSCHTKIDGKIGVYVQTNKVNPLDSTTLNIILLTHLPSGQVKEIILLGEAKSKVTESISSLEVNPLDRADIESNQIFSEVYQKYSKRKSLVCYRFETSSSHLIQIGGELCTGDSIYFLGFGIFQLPN